MYEVVGIEQAKQRSHKIKILVCIDWFAPGYKAGGPIQSCVNFVHILENDCEIYILTSDTDLNETEPYKTIVSNCWTNFGTSSKVNYLSSKYLNYRTIKHKIEEVNPDFLYLNSMFSYRFTVQPLLYSWANSSNIKVVLAPRGMLHSGALQYGNLKKRVFLYFSRFFIRHNVIFHATDEQEKKDIEKFYKKNAINVIANIPNSFSKELKDNSPIIKNRNQLKLIFVSRVSPKKNLEFLLNIFKGVNKDYTILLSVLGEVDSEMYLQKIKKIIDELPSHIKVEIKGAIPHEKVYEHLKEHHFFVLPTYGENFGHAIFESFLVGRPVVISDQTPWRNLEAEKVGFDLPLQQPERWLEVLEILANMNQEAYDEWSAQTQHYARRYLENSDSKKKYLYLFSNESLI